MNSASQQPSARRSWTLALRRLHRSLSSCQRRYSFAWQWRVARAQPLSPGVAPDTAGVLPRPRLAQPPASRRTAPQISRTVFVVSGRAFSTTVQPESRQDAKTPEKKMLALNLFLQIKLRLVRVRSSRIRSLGLRAPSGLRVFSSVNWIPHRVFAIEGRAHD